MLKFTYQVTAILATGATRMEVSFFGTVSNIQNTKSYIFLILTIVMMIGFEKFDILNSHFFSSLLNPKLIKLKFASFTEAA